MQRYTYDRNQFKQITLNSFVFESKVVDPDIINNEIL